MTATPAELVARVRALNEHYRGAVLYYLTGFAPEAVERALDEIEAQQAQAGS